MTASPPQEPGTGPDEWILHLMQHHAQRGYVAEVPEELRSLFGRCDGMMARPDLSLTVLCMVHRREPSEPGIEVERDEFVGWGRECLPYTGSVNGVKMPVGFRVCEVGHGVPSAADCARLAALQKTRPGKERVTVDAFYLDADNGQVWSPAWANGLLRGRRWLEAVLRAPKDANALLAPDEVALPQDRRFPVATVALLVVLALAFGVEHWAKLVGEASGLLGIDVHTLLALGGMNRGQVLDDGEWYRLLTAALLHGDVLHLVFNGLALLLAGLLLEYLLGSAWFLLLFLLGALGGSTMGLALNPDSVVSVGASGAVMGLLAAAFVVTFRIPPGARRSAIQGQLMRFLIPSLIPLAIRDAGNHIDYAAHLGGALIGVLVGLAALRLWPKRQAQVRFGGWVKALATVGVLAFAVSASAAARGYRDAAGVLRIVAADLLASDDTIPADPRVAQAEVDSWGKAYPRDPRVRLFRATKMLEVGDVRGGEAELRAAIAEQDILRNVFPNGMLDITLRGILVDVLVQQGRLEEARAVALPRCRSGDGSVPEQLRDLGVCD